MLKCVKWKCNYFASCRASVEIYGTIAIFIGILESESFSELGSLLVEMI